MGVCDEAYPKNLLPGWEKTSIAFHTDEGSLFNSSDDEEPLNQPCKKGDSVKCILVAGQEHPGKVTVELYRNERKVAEILTEVPPGGFYGVIGMMSKGERVQLSPPMVIKRTEFYQIWEVNTPNTISHHGNGICSYTGPGDFGDDSIGTVRGKFPIDPFGPLHMRSFELLILDPGEHKYIAIGVCSETYPKHMLPGWEETSVGYHADNGNLFHSCGDGRPTDHPCKKGDVMRCTVEPVDGSPKRLNVLFHKNGYQVGQVSAWTPQRGFYASFGMMSKGEKVQAILPDILLPYSTPKKQFHDVWEISNPNLKHQENGICSYVGVGGSDHVATVRSKVPLTPLGPNNTFEVKIVNPGDHCFIALGVCSKSYLPSNLPGWEENSVGFHADNGLIMQSSLGEQQTSHPCHKGDVVRCTLEPVDNSDKRVSVVFHRNGNYVGKAVMWTPMEGLYAQVGAMGCGEAFQVASPLMEPSFLKHEVTEGMSAAASRQSPMFMEPAIHPMLQKYPSVELRDQPQMEEKHIVEERYMEAPPDYAGMTAQSETERRGMYAHYHPFFHPYMRPPSHWHARVPPYPHPLHPLHPYFSAYGMLSHPAAHIPPSHSPVFDRNPQSPYFVPIPHPNTADTATLFGSHPFYHQPPLEPHPHAGNHLGATSTPYSTSTATTPQSSSRLDLKSSPIYAMQVSVASDASESDAIYESQFSVESSASDDFTDISNTSLSSFVKGSNDTSTSCTATTGISPIYNSQTSTGSITRTEVAKIYSDMAEPERDLTTEEGNVLLHAPGGQTHSHIHSHSPLPIHSSLSLGATPHLAKVETVGITKGDLLQEQIIADYPDSLATPLAISQPTTVTNSSPQSSVFILPKPLDTLEPTRMDLKQEEVRLIPKDEDKMFQTLHNVRSNEDGSLQCTVPVHSTEIAFVMCRLPATEKIPYFEVEIQHLGTGGDVAAGIVWNRYPTTMLPGMLRGSIAFHSSKGAVYTGMLDCKPVTTRCISGDVIGCKIHLKYKSETSTPGQEGRVEVEFFKNGISAGTDTILLPPSGFYPTIGLCGTGTKVKISYSICITQNSYFETHPLPETYRNFTTGPSIHTGWNCIWNSKIENDKYISLLEPHRGQPAVVQSCLPFSDVTPYFEVECLHPASLFSVLSVGVLPKTHSESKETVPGEVSNSIGYNPLFGFVMKDGVVVTKGKPMPYRDKITLGVGVDFNPKSALSSTPIEGRISVFFTVNGQLINFTEAILPKSGFYPTVALDCSSRISDQQLVAVQFPKHGPTTKGLPLGFARGEPVNALEVSSIDLLDARGSKISQEDSSIRVFQAAFPLCPAHTYYELKIMDGGDNYSISCGLASSDYPLNIHPGEGKDSIAVHISNGNLVCNSEHEVVAAPCRYKGAVIGCGVRFPEDDSSRYAEVFFTINQKMITQKFVSVPNLGFFPTIGLNTSGALITLEMNAPDPLPDLHFNTSWECLMNMKVEGTKIQLVNPSEKGAAVLEKVVSPGDTLYYEITPLSDLNGKLCIGISNATEVMQRPRLPEDRVVSMDIVTGEVMSRDQFSFRKGTCSVGEGGHRFGWGLQPLSSSSEMSLLFFTVDRQVVYCAEVDICTSPKKLCSFIFMLNSTATVSVDTCVSWPPTTPIGEGWGRYANLTRENLKITTCNSFSNTTNLQSCSKTPLGFAQTAMPLMPTNAYFEVEVCSREINKAIAVGVASRNCPSDSWVGWQKESAAYHLNEGTLFTGAGKFGHSIIIGPKVSAGSTVGCGITFTSNDHAIAIRGGDNLEVFFTVNGAIIGTHEMTIPPGGLFPTICLETPAESIIFHSRSQYPPVPNSVGSEWASAYSLHQAGRILEHSCKHQVLHGDIPIPKAFCQAKQPFSPKTPYFEVEIQSLSNLSQIAGGAAALIAKGSTAVSTDSIMYSCSGQLVTRKGSIKSTGGTQKCGVGDKLGCALIFEDEQPSSIEFYLNNMKVLYLNLAEKWKNQALYPTIILTHPGDAVIPTLHLPLPKWDPSSLVGWLRSERVKLRNNVLEYLGPGSTTSDVGVAQVSQPLQLNSNSYYEIEILDPGAKCTIAIGAAMPDYPLNCQPGWSSNSIAYHGDDGCLFQSNSTGVCFGPKWKVRDTVGLGIRSFAGQKDDTEVQVYFTRNGKEVGHTTTTLPPSGLFPTIGLCSAHEKVRVHLSPSISFNCCVLAWRTLCGLKVTRLHDRRGQIVEYRDNGRMTPNSGVKLALGIGSQPFSKTMQYFEVKIVSFGDLKAIAVGVVPKSYNLEYAPGWVDGSIAYHTDNGELYRYSGKGKVFGPVAQKGDVIGCGVSFTPTNNKHCSLFFTYNGMEIGRLRAAIPDGGLYPSVGLTSEKDRAFVYFLETFKPRLPQSELNFVGLMRINNCSYSDQILHFTGGGNSSYSQAPAMAQFSVPLHNARNYFTANLVKSSDTILIGVAARDYPMKYAPGYTSVSVAYDITKGSIRAVFSSDNFHNLEAPKCKIGDTIGCGIATEMADPKTARYYIFFTKNGMIVKKIEMIEAFEDLYPIVGIIPNGRSSALFMDWNTPVFEPQNVF